MIMDYNVAGLSGFFVVIVVMEKVFLYWYTELVLYFILILIFGCICKTIFILSSNVVPVVRSEGCWVVIIWTRCVRTKPILLLRPFLRRGEAFFRKVPTNFKCFSRDNQSQPRRQSCLSRQRHGLSSCGEIADSNEQRDHIQSVLMMLIKTRSEIACLPSTTVLLSLLCVWTTCPMLFGIAWRFPIIPSRTLEH